MVDSNIAGLALIAFFLLSGGYAAFKLGSWLTRLLILWLFCRNSKLEDIAWKMVTVSEMRYGKLKGQQSYTLRTAGYSVKVMRNQHDQEQVKPKPTPLPTP